ncbi:epoxide hydrolase B [Rosa chinensis]|nr:epoxide hydrolase B [Rosa chinensis]
MGLSPSMAPPSRGLVPGPPLRTLLQTTIRTPYDARFSSWAIPGSLAITKGILEPAGRAEADFGRFDVKLVIRNIYILLCGSEVPVAAKDQEIMDLFDPAIPLPPWFSEEDLSVYASLYEKSGFRFPLQIPYRSLAVDCGYTDPKVSAPTLLIMGEKDYILKISGFGDYIRTGAVKQFVPDLDIKYIAEGNHFMQEQLPEQINQLILTFLGKHGI